MLGSRDQAVFDPAIPADGILVGTGMEESQVERFFIIRVYIWEAALPGSGPRNYNSPNGRS